MPNIIDLVDQLEASGVAITGREKVLALEASVDWPVQFIHLVTQGKKNGVEFVRASANAPSDVVLARLLNGYPFGFAQRETILHNIMAKDLAPTDVEGSSFTVLRHVP